MGFLDMERDYIREKLLPDFDWVRFTLPTEPTPLTKPLAECRVALTVTAGAYLRKGQERFDLKNRLGDDSFRVIPNGTAPEDISLGHPGYDTRRAMQDLDTVFPYQLLNRLQGEGAIGEAAPRHVSFMGFVPRPERLIWQTAPQAGRLLRQDGVDLVILVPS
jgi:hypothetical protein